MIDAFDGMYVNYIDDPSDLLAASVVETAGQETLHSCFVCLCLVLQRFNF